MLNVPTSYRSLIDNWKTNGHRLEGGPRLHPTGRPQDYTLAMDTVVSADNTAHDADMTKGLVVFKGVSNPQEGLGELTVGQQSGETHRFSGDSKQGELETVRPDGTVYAFQFADKTIEFLQISPGSNGTLVVFHQHVDRESGRGFAQLGS